MTIQNRDSFLDNVAKSLGRPRLTEGVKRPKWSLSPQWDVYEGYSADQLVDVLERQCIAIHTDFKRTDKAGLSETLKEVIEGYAGKKLIAVNDHRNEEFGLPAIFEELHQKGIHIRIWDSTRGKENQVYAEMADIGITFSDITLAESGTLTLFNDKNNSRTISLLPRVHVAIIPKSTLVPRITQATNRIHEANEQGREVSSCVSFISGPSNSADIEMNLIVGVHGPVQATYIVVDD
ncbi:LutC/YkgG family protein [Lederbergia lenta]|uniref:Lactate utilization protein C n=1 Tax=Lederbergia lenta TaxID=1467 RepID=A0A2X4W9V9_LEDLE|nr:lactate utilization protein C [Lederbergia lenta]MCM3113449.1 lactate utilization protein C [Lederbergia lenta]MEC2326689.1 lactate utilization protein C [Lederbergia lenta]SQI61447.1 putative subunit of an iron-sulfur protein [Lederbergia lenta]